MSSLDNNDNAGCSTPVQNDYECSCLRNCRIDPEVHFSFEFCECRSIPQGSQTQEYCYWTPQKVRNGLKEIYLKQFGNRPCHDIIQSSVIQDNTGMAPIICELLHHKSSVVPAFECREVTPLILEARAKNMKELCLQKYILKPNTSESSNPHEQSSNCLETNVTLSSEDQGNVSLSDPSFGKAEVRTKRNLKDGSKDKDVSSFSELTPVSDLKLPVYSNHDSYKSIAPNDHQVEGFSWSIIISLVIFVFLLFLGLFCNWTSKKFKRVSGKVVK